jgi:mannose-6-phosphate isomerase-like protein (cupin superfamily)
MGDDVVELQPEQMLVVPPDTPHGFRNVGDVPLLVVSVHTSGTLRQTWLGEEPG